MAEYGAKASEKVEKAMHERKRGALKSGSGKKVTSKKQAIAALSAESVQRGPRYAALRWWGRAAREQCPKRARNSGKLARSASIILRFCRIIVSGPLRRSGENAG